MNFQSFARLPEPKLNKYKIYILIIKDIVNDYKNNYKNINFETDFSSKNYELKIDKSQISRVISKFID